MNRLTNAPHSACCPLCGGPNACVLAAADDGAQQPAPCWCTQQSIAPDVLARVPAEALGRACICRACALEEGARPRPRV